MYKTILDNTSMPEPPLKPLINQVTHWNAGTHNPIGFFFFERSFFFIHLGSPTIRLAHYMTRPFPGFPYFSQALVTLAFSSLFSPCCCSFRFVHSPTGLPRIISTTGDVPHTYLGSVGTIPNGTPRSADLIQILATPIYHAPNRPRLFCYGHLAITYLVHTSLNTLHTLRCCVV